jgi:hypothetical protein
MMIPKAAVSSMGAYQRSKTTPDSSSSEAQFLDDAFNGSFQSMSELDETPRLLLSAILHAFRDIGDDQLTLVTCGRGLSINTRFLVEVKLRSEGQLHQL